MADCTQRRSCTTVGPWLHGPSPSAQRARTSRSGRAALAYASENMPVRAPATLATHETPVPGAAVCIQTPSVLRYCASTKAPSDWRGPSSTALQRCACAGE